MERFTEVEKIGLFHPQNCGKPDQVHLEVS